MASGRPNDDSSTTGLLHQLLNATLPDPSQTALQNSSEAFYKQSLNLIKCRLDLISSEAELNTLIQNLAQTGLLHHIAAQNNPALTQALIKIFDPNNKFEYSKYLKTQSLAQFIMLTYQLSKNINLDLLNPFTADILEETKCTSVSLDLVFRYILSNEATSKRSTLVNLFKSPYILQHLYLSKETSELFHKKLKYLCCSEKENGKNVSDFLIATNKILHQSDAACGPADEKEENTNNRGGTCHPYLLDLIKQNVEYLDIDDKPVWSLLGKFIASLSVTAIHNLMGVALLAFKNETLKHILPHLDAQKKRELFKLYFFTKNEEQVSNSCAWPLLHIFRDMTLNNPFANQFLQELCGYVSVFGNDRVLEAGKAMYYLTDTPIKTKELGDLLTSLGNSLYVFQSSKLYTLMKKYIQDPQNRLCEMTAPHSSVALTLT